MSADNGDLDTLMLGVENAGPTDATPLLVAADWCDENDQPDLAYALRWCTARKVRPFFRAEIKRYPWQWLRRQKTYIGMTRSKVRARAAATLDQPVFDLMRIGVEALIVFDSCWLAYECLAQALAKLRKAIAVGDLPSVVVKPAEIKLVVCPDCGVARDAIRERCPVCAVNCPALTSNSD